MANKKTNFLLILMLITHCNFVQTIGIKSAIIVASAGMFLARWMRITTAEIIKNSEKLTQEYEEFRKKVLNCLKMNDASKFDAEKKALESESSELSANIRALDVAIAAESLWPWNASYQDKFEAWKITTAKINQNGCTRELEKLDAKSKHNFFVQFFGKFGTKEFSKDSNDAHSLEKITREIVNEKSAYPVRKCFNAVNETIDLLEKYKADIPCDPAFMAWLCAFKEKLKTSDLLRKDNIIFEKIQQLKRNANAQKAIAQASKDQARALQAQAAAQRSIAFNSAIAAMRSSNYPRN